MSSVAHVEQRTRQLPPFGCAGDGTQGFGAYEASALTLSLEKGLCFAVWLSDWFFFSEQGMGRRTRGKGVLGLVPAVDDGIHTTQVQVDEATVIRFSPIVYNKELVKTELLDQMTLLPPRPDSYQGHDT